VHEKCGPTSEYCFKCGMPLDEDKILLMETESQKMREKFFDISKIDGSIIDDFKKILEIVETINSNPKMKEEIESFII